MSATTDPAGRALRLDRFQREAVAAIDRGESVLVAAPTGAGKTVVAEHAVAEVLSGSGRVFYTTPIKALSNQKYTDLARRHGEDRVGLLTGDNSINGGAPVVVMTTEVLRNMIYAGRDLDDLRFVVLDEVHYLQDAYRGPVWEEVIIHLPGHVRLVCLSATVSNTDDLADWISTVRGPIQTVVELERPVELEHLYAVTDRFEHDLVILPTLTDDGTPNLRGSDYDSDRITGRGGRRGRGRRRWATPRRVEIVDALGEADLLPTIVFVFSRAGCDDAVRTALRAGVRLTTPDERRRIRRIADRHLADLGVDDLRVLDHEAWAAGLEAGVASHHAGLVPPFKETVEACFVEGLVKVVFATETLALGVNMPARSVVIESLSKFTGERHELLTPGQYTQITGRAGRRGIDEHGSAVVLWSPYVGFETVARLASSRRFELTSAFRPTYNMAVNLVRRQDPDAARRLIALSFAQYQTDRTLVRAERRLDERRAELADLVDRARCERGDVDEYLRLVEASRGRRRPRRASRGLIERGLAHLQPGDVLDVPAGTAPGRVAVLSVAQRKRGAVRVRSITRRGRIVNLGADDFGRPPDPVAAVDLPTPFLPNDDGFRAEVADRLRHATRPPRRSPSPSGAPPEDSIGDPDDHPVAACPDADRHLRAARKVSRARRSISDLETQAHDRSGSLARLLERVLEVLEGRGYVDGWHLTADGERVARIYHESDLLVAEAVRHGTFDGVDAPTLAGLVSCLTYEHRSAEPPPPPWFPSVAAEGRWRWLAETADDLRAEEGALGLPQTRPPDPGFLPLAHAWASGRDLGAVLAEEDLSGGDFVRNCRQLLDLLRQVADVVPSPVTAAVARDAIARTDRGIVAASSRVGVT